MDLKPIEEHTEEPSRRNRTRTHFTTHALIRFRRKLSARGVVRDVSLESAYIFCKAKLDPGEKVDLEMILLGEDSELSIKVSGKITRRDTQGVAIAFNQTLEWWPVFTYFPLKQIDPAVITAMPTEKK